MEGFTRFFLSQKRNNWQQGFIQSFCFIFMCLTKHSSRSIHLSKIIWSSSQQTAMDSNPHPNVNYWYLKYIRSFGNDASNVSLGTFFWIGFGSANIFCSHALIAVLLLKPSAYFWPNNEEQKLILLQIKEKHHFPNCIGLMDGTLFLLNTKSHLHKETYFTQKGNYCVHMLIVCNDAAQIIYFIAGWPRSVHNNGVWKNCNLFLNCQDFSLLESTSWLIWHSLPANMWCWHLRGWQVVTQTLR